MTTAIEVSTENDFIRITAKGKHNVGQGRDSLRQIADTAATNGKLLIDVRDAVSFLSLPDMRTLVEEFAELGIGAGRKTAILCTADRFDNVHFFAVSARSMGLDVQAFSSFDEARDWLTL